MRTLILIGFAFVAGMIFEMVRMAERCDAAGGDTARGICIGVTE